MLNNASYHEFQAMRSAQYTAFIFNKMKQAEAMMTTARNQKCDTLKERMFAHMQGEIKEAQIAADRAWEAAKESDSLTAWNSARTAEYYVKMCVKMVRDASFLIGNKP